MLLALFASGTYVPVPYRYGTPYHTDSGPDPGFKINSDSSNPNVNPDPGIHEKLKKIPT
jgi:hypothetical protein